MSAKRFDVPVIRVIFYFPVKCKHAFRQFPAAAADKPSVVSRQQNGTGTNQEHVALPRRFDCMENAVIFGNHRAFGNNANGTLYVRLIRMNHSDIILFEILFCFFRYDSCVAENSVIQQQQVKNRIPRVFGADCFPMHDGPVHLLEPIEQLILLIRNNRRSPAEIGKDHIRVRRNGGRQRRLRLRRQDLDAVSKDFTARFSR
ncbi:MAG: hypothetical protein IJL26_10595 [Clostridia bacterium]|nr:hypothetical protein [Clostridia bacterium]